MNRISLNIIFSGVFLLSSCQTDYAPKPRGFFRIDLPQKNYTLIDTIPAYQFESPDYALLSPDDESPWEKNWITINFPEFKGSLHISYKPVDDNLAVYLEDMHTMLIKHLPKASAIQDSLIYAPERDVYGLLFSIQGKSVASPLQFYLTDSTNHFVRGALYFNIRPNNDSLAPVINFLRKDVDHFIETLNWKDQVSN
ncbi:MAG: gliding motility lipoprotein GldD [Bacteroidales bacterium]|jgi:gliding motility-associated lipoprotein GldD|nr:gliding motility lipoprotein GldD [Bacteroidales bacterium]